MILRITLVILFISFLNGCSNQGSERSIAEVSSNSNSLTLAESNPGDLTSVCGVIYQVSDFSSWVAEYKKIAQGTIILLRNVKEPSLLMVFEGGNSHEMIEGRAAKLVDEEFLRAATALGEPVVSYYDVQYMNPNEEEHQYYVGLIFEIIDINSLLESVRMNINIYDSYGLLPMGIGADTFNPSKVFMLLTLDDFVSFQKKTNSPRKIKRFAKSLGLPEETLILNMARAKL
jgi:hypothetical protein